METKSEDKNWFYNESLWLNLHKNTWKTKFTQLIIERLNWILPNN